MMGLCSCGAGLKEMNFKTTIKGAARIGQIAMGDLWVHVLSFILLVVSLGVGVHKLINGAGRLFLQRTKYHIRLVLCSYESEPHS